MTDTPLVDTVRRWHAGRLGDRVPYDPFSPSQHIARTGMILRAVVGSEVHGTAIEGTDDTDEMGVAIEPVEYVIGSQRFSHYEYRTAVRPEGMPADQHPRSAAGDLDLIVYSLRRFVALATAGNPSILVPLFVEPEHVRYSSAVGEALRANVEMLLSRQVGRKFAGYLHGQRQGLLGLRTGARNRGRTDVIARYGFDTKYAAHMVRLGLQGVELLQTGRITLPMPEPHRQWLRELRVGQHTKDEALEWAADLEANLVHLTTRSALPERPDMRRVDSWVSDVHLRHWGFA